MQLYLIKFSMYWSQKVFHQSTDGFKLTINLYQFVNTKS